MQLMTDRRTQVVTGLVPPQLDEAVIRVAWPSVATVPSVAALGRRLIRSILFAPLGWLLLAPFYFRKVLPGLGRSYALTNRRLMIQTSLTHKPVREVALADIDDVRIKEDGNSRFYRTASLEVLSKDRVVLTLPGVVGPESFRHAVLNACKAWVPGKADTGHFIPASASKST
jgi:hypothetical protein